MGAYLSILAEKSTKTLGRCFSHSFSSCPWFLGLPMSLATLELLGFNMSFLLLRQSYSVISELGTLRLQFSALVSTTVSSTRTAPEDATVVLTGTEWSIALDKTDKILLIVDPKRTLRKGTTTALRM